MKNLKTGTIGMLIIALLFSVSTFSQRGTRMGYGQGNDNGQGYFCNNIPNISTDQQSKITDFRLAHLKEMQTNRNQLAIKSANLQALRTEGNIKSINKTIDEMGVIRTNMQKSKEQHIQDIRSILTADQQVYFDNSNRGTGNGQGYCKGNRQGQGNRQGNGRNCGNW
ncbi:Spy/CpxP family protein refolding chaperone [Lutibacter sp.]|uniref:Spy/CpxP family protein refolding chaperone n=1 Tax=Lutibacter sp. TaxID=1925666 RepID=UPI00356489FD